MASLYARKPPVLLFFSSGLHREHFRVLLAVTAYGAAIALFWPKLLGIDNKPSDLPSWTQLHANAATFTGALIVSTTVVWTGILCLRRIPCAISRWRIELGYAETSKEVLDNEAPLSSPIEADALALKLPQNYSIRLVAPRSIQRLLNHAKQHAEPNPAAAMEAARDEAAAEVAGISLVQRSLLHLGILGTFVGLIVAMPNLSDLLKEGTFNKDSLSAPLRGLFGALGTCFGTSVAGLLGSMTVSAALHVLHTVQGQALAQLDESLLTLQSVIRKRCFQIGDKGFDTVLMLLKEQNKHLAECLQTTKESIAAFTHLRQSSAKFVDSVSDQFKALNATFTNTGLATTLASAISSAIQQATEEARQQLQVSTSSGLDDTSSAIHTAAEAMERQTQQLKAEYQLTRSMFEELSGKLLEAARSDSAVILSAKMHEFRQELLNIEERIRQERAGLYPSLWERSKQTIQELYQAIREQIRRRL